MLDVAEIRMLRSMCGVTKLDKIRNKSIRNDNGENLKTKYRPGKKSEVLRGLPRKRRLEYKCKGKAVQ